MRGKSIIFFYFVQYITEKNMIISKKYDEAITKELKEIAERMGTTVEIVSTETEEGEQFYSIAGVGAILRFKV